MKEILKTGFDALEIDYTNEIFEKLQMYNNILMEWNKNINLTAITDEEEVATKHFIDSLTIYKGVFDKKTLIDVGTGAGFPGIVLNIVGFKGEIQLMDSVNKRIKFLNAVISELDLHNIYTLHGRAEEESRNTDHREKYEVATARAVAPLNILAEYCLPYVKVGGYFYAMKGTKIEEIDASKNAIRVLGGEIEEVQKLVLPNSDYKRNIIVVKKTRETFIKYPRNQGQIKKDPL